MLLSEASILYLRLRHHPVHEVMGSGSLSPRASRVKVWVMSGSMDKARSLLGRFCDVWEGEGTLSADFPSRADRVPDWEV